MSRAATTARSPLAASLATWLNRPLTSLHLLVAIFGLLTLLGLVMVLSASHVVAFERDGSSYTVFVHQLLFVCVGLVLFWIALRLPIWLLRRLSLPFLLVCVIALALVLTPLGSAANGAQSWFRVGPASLQPAEPAKLALALWGAHVLVTKRALLSRWRHVLVPVVPVAVLIFALVMLQPDLGTTLILAIVLLALLWFAGAPTELVGMILIGAAAGGVTMTAIAGYRSQRIQAFLHPGADPLGANYQAQQALFSLADGGLWGVGLGQSSAKWDYLPNAHNDFIFAIIGEELGFLGAALVLVLFGLLTYVGMRIAARNTDPWIKLVSATVTTWIVGQAAINIGYVVGLLPVTGLPLPMISAGGSSVTMTMFSFGLLANFALHEPPAISALRAGQRGTGKGRRLVWLLRLGPPEPYRPPARPAAGRAR